jgi:hypothetical protein
LLDWKKLPPSSPFFPLFSNCKTIKRNIGNDEKNR